MPRLSGLDESADELPVDELGALAGGTSSTAHPAASHDRRPPLPGSAVGRRRVLRLLASAPESSALRRAEPLVVRDGQELARAAIAVALPVGARHPEPQLVRTTRPAGGADRLVPVTCVKRLRTAATALQHHALPCFPDNPKPGRSRISSSGRGETGGRKLTRQGGFVPPCGDPPNWLLICNASSKRRRDGQETASLRALGGTSRRPFSSGGETIQGGVGKRPRV